jgi:hypothetical protein
LRDDKSSGAIGGNASDGGRIEVRDRNLSADNGTARWILDGSGNLAGQALAKDSGSE